MRFEDLRLTFINRQSVDPRRTTVASKESHAQEINDELADGRGRGGCGDPDSGMRWRLLERRGHPR
jgi:hypothetical protein